jgi:hypothetical protein
MSWNVQQDAEHEDIKALRAAITYAESRNIIMCCAASDTKGTSKSSDPYFPCSWSNTISIGAADWNHRPQRYLGNDYAYLFPGEFVLSEEEAEGRDGGNSAATALASGLAALVLFCLKQDGVDVGKNGPKTINKLFTDLAMVEKTFTHFVDIADMLKLDGKEERVSCQAVASRCKGFLPVKVDSTMSEGGRW